MLQDYTLIALGCGLAGGISLKSGLSLLGVIFEVDWARETRALISQQVMQNRGLTP